MPIRRFYELNQLDISSPLRSAFESLKALLESNNNQYISSLTNNLAVEIVSGSISVNGIQYQSDDQTLTAEANAGVVNLPLDERVYIDHLEGKEALVIVEEGELLVSGYPFNKKQIAWTSGIEQFVISAKTDNTVATIFSIA